MQAARSAQIILFPMRKTAENSQNERLTNALTALDFALAEQRVAVAAWRETLTELRGIMSGLGASLTDYQDSLARLGTQVAAVNSDAQAMEDWTDAVLAPGA